MKQRIDNMVPVMQNFFSDKALTNTIKYFSNWHTLSLDIRLINLEKISCQTIYIKLKKSCLEVWKVKLCNAAKFI